MIIYDALVRILALSTPIMAVLSFPLCLRIAGSLHTMTSTNEKERVMAELKHIIRLLTILLLPYTFGAFATTLFTINTPQRNWIGSTVLLRLYHILGILPFAFLPSVIIFFGTLLKGEQKAARWLGIWLGGLWALLYLSLTLQFYAYPG